MELMKITDLTSQLGISSRTLRYYEQMGLIQSIRMQFEKYRFYDNENVERIKQIIVLRKMQIPIKDIIRIYESRDMTVLVESFVTRVNSIDQEIFALKELKQIINKFMQAMINNGINHISALPLLYEKMEKQLVTDSYDNREVTYERLSALTDLVSTPLDLTIVDLPSMRMLSSIRKDTGISDVNRFWDWLGSNKIPYGTPGSHTLFEYQDDNAQTVIIQKIDNELFNDSPYRDYVLEGGLFAVGGIYADDDIPSFHQRMIKTFDDNSYYEVDYRHDGGLRHESLIETVISTDSRRDKVNVLLPVKKRQPIAEQYDPGEQILDITLEELEQANPVLYECPIPLNEITPINYPHYKILETGEAEYI